MPKKSRKSKKRGGKPTQARPTKSSTLNDKASKEKIAVLAARTARQIKDPLYKLDKTEPKLILLPEIDLPKPLILPEAKAEALPKFPEPKPLEDIMPVSGKNVEIVMPEDVLEQLGGKIEAYIGKQIKRV